MKLLLDTHTFLWLVVGSPNLGGAARVALADPANELFLSVASVWELAIKTSSPNPQLKLAVPLDAYLAKWTAIYQLDLLPIQSSHALHVVGLPHHHRDPFDRLLIAQAMVEGMTLVSGDGKFASYPVTILW
jgi:PIN domain nuclease of toxin-antitoxin system